LIQLHFWLRRQQRSTNFKQIPKHQICWYWST